MQKLSSNNNNNNNNSSIYNNNNFIVMEVLAVPLKLIPKYLVKLKKKKNKQLNIHS